MIDFASIERETRERWDTNSFVEQGVTALLNECSFLRAMSTVVPWVRYETYMMAQLVCATPEQVGLLRILFPPEAAEDSKFHVHPCSDRVVTVMEGQGLFSFRKQDGSLQGLNLERGFRVWMPRGIPHTFFAGPNGLVVESIHNPFFAFDDPRCLVYPEEKGD